MLSEHAWAEVLRERRLEVDAEHNREDGEGAQEGVDIVRVGELRHIESQPCREHIRWPRLGWGPVG